MVSSFEKYTGTDLHCTNPNAISLCLLTFKKLKNSSKQCQKTRKLMQTICSLCSWMLNFVTGLHWPPDRIIVTRWSEFSLHVFLCWEDLVKNLLAWHLNSFAYYLLIFSIWSSNIWIYITQKLQGIELIAIFHCYIRMLHATLNEGFLNLSILTSRK